MPGQEQPHRNPAQVLCQLSELAQNEGRGFYVGIENRRRAVFVVRRGDTVYGYVNSCPHTGVMLDWSPNRFMDADGELIVCATHGARFRVEDGLCVSGPCMGEHLASITLEVHDGRVLINPATAFS